MLNYEAKLLWRWISVLKYHIYVHISSIFVFCLNADCVTESPVMTTENVQRKGSENLPIMQYIIGFAVVGATKIILSVFSIRVNKVDLFAHTV